MFIQALPVEQTEFVESTNNLNICRLKAEDTMYNMLTVWAAELHRKEHLKEAEMRRWFEGACKPQSNWSQRFGLALSGLLIASGEKLRERYDPGSCDSCYETL
jgi:hypothetical protein